MNIASKHKDQRAGEAIPYQEYLLRVLFTSFYPAVKMGIDLNYPLDTIKDMMTLALWQEAKKKHSTINLISLIFGKSTRTLKSLSARYNKGLIFETSETNMCRQIEDLLRKEPMTAEMLASRLPHYNEFDGARMAISILLKSGRIYESLAPDGRTYYRAVERHHNLYSDDWERRLDGLSEHLEVISETLKRRFLEQPADSIAAARTFTLKARTEDVEAFREELLQFIRQKCQELEKKADLIDLSAEEVKEFSLYLGITPTSRDKGNK